MIKERKIESIRFETKAVIYQNETGFKILAGVAYNADSGEMLRKCSLKGQLSDVEDGDTLFVSGDWDEHPKYGVGFRAEAYVKAVPQDKKSMLAYLKHGAVMTAIPNFDRKYYPTTVKNVIQRLPSDVQKALFEEFAGNSLLYKDFMTDKFLATMRLTDLDKKFNKLDYFQSAFPDVAFPKTANKMNCYELYAIGCAEKYIEPEQTGLLFEKDYRIDKVQDFTPSKRRCKEIGKNYIKSILKQKVTEEVLYEFDFFIDDYVEMAMELKEKIDIKAGKKKIRKLHDKYAERLLKKKHRGKIKIPETPLKYLELPKEFILLDAPGALCQEQKRQHNCVSSYIGRIEKGSCIIYSADINGEHVTIEIRYRKTRGKYTFIVPQCLKMWNECCSEETLKYVKEQVKEAGEQAVKKYERKIERKAKNQ